MKIKHIRFYPPNPRKVSIKDTLLFHIFAPAMIETIVIKNFGIIKEAELKPCAGFNVLTGETGAGKSMILSALNLVFGKRQSVAAAFDPSLKTVVEIIVSGGGDKIKSFFELNDIEPVMPLIVRREISPSGRSRAFVNDTPVGLGVLRRLAALIVDVSEQHQTLSIFHKSKRLQLIDDYAGNENLLGEYAKVFFEEQNLKSRLKSLKEELAKLEAEQDYYRFQMEELEALNYQKGEDKALERELEILTNAEEIKSSLYAAFEVLTAEEYGVEALVEEAVRKLKPAAAYDKKAEELLSRLTDVSFELSEIGGELDDEFNAVEYSKERLAAVDERLSEIYRLMKKHHLSSGDGLLSVYDDYASKLGSFDNLKKEIKELEIKYKQVIASLEERALRLSEARRRVIGEMGKKATALLHEMAIPSALVEFKISEAEAFGEDGRDEAMIFFTANKGVEPAPVEEVASGGELSRLMLALISLIGVRKQMPTLIFDEIDTGISGETAVKVGEMMKKLSLSTQLITVSHLPQIAAKADLHFEIFKNEEGERTVSGVKLLSPEERVEALATMLSGKRESQKARSTAREMLEGA